MSNLALLGGKPVRTSSIPWVNTMGTEETEAVLNVMNKGCLSAFIGRSGTGFLGGEMVREVERNFVEKFGSRFAISVNSATTGLHAAIAACGIGPGDEVLVSPYTIVATSSAILMNNAVPIFVDVEQNTFNMDPAKIEQWITSRTRAIVVVNLLGLPANLPEIMRIAQKHNLYVIEDNAQSPGASINGKFTGSFGHLGVYSLNYHKVIHSGEGGIIVTDDENLARRCQLIRNHGEMVMDDEADYETVVLGSNYRMTELHAAIAVEQLKKLDAFLVKRRAIAAQLTSLLTNIPGLIPVHVPEGFTHSYYDYPIRYDRQVWGISREKFAEAMEAEGFPVSTGYIKPTYLIPMYQHRKVYNQTNIPFSFIEQPTQQYKRGICPVVERMFDEELVLADVCREPFTSEDIQCFADAIMKIWDERGKLEVYEKSVVSST